MKVTRFKLIGIALCCSVGISLSSCKNSNTKTNTTEIKADTLVNFSVRPAADWTGLFYKKGDWFGADGVFSMRLDGVETQGGNESEPVFMYFSDTMTGTVLQDSVANFKMVNNSIATLNGIAATKENVNIQLNYDEAKRPTNYFSPNTPNSTENEYYWFGDGFVNQADNNSINIFGYRVIDHSEKSWDFELTGVTILTIPADDKTPFENHTQIDAPLFVDIPEVGKGTYGSAVYVNTKEAGAPAPDGYLYIYGLLEPNKQLVVSRVKPTEFTNFEAWSYWDGTNWNEDIKASRPITNRVSNEVSLTPLKDGRYLLVFQEDGIGEHTAIRIAESPVGPFGPIQRIWQVPEVNDPPGIIPYNAKAHPVLSTEDELLISYNTISADYFNDILKFPHMYRPRFFWLKIEE